VLVSPKDPEAIALGVEKVWKKEWSTSQKKIFSWEEFVDRHIEVFSAFTKGKG
jgi:hypothetical protein